jgi:hypothetical protein
MIISILLAGTLMITVPRDELHGSPYDRGRADSWYQRGKDPHWYPNGSYVPPRVEEHEMTQDQIDLYNLGYDENEAAGGHKDYGE